MTSVRRLFGHLPVASHKVARAHLISIREQRSAALFGTRESVRRLVRHVAAQQAENSRPRCAAQVARQSRGRFERANSTWRNTRETPRRALLTRTLKQAAVQLANFYLVVRVDAQKRKQQDSNKNALYLRPAADRTLMNGCFSSGAPSSLFRSGRLNTVGQTLRPVFFFRFVLFYFALFPYFFFLLLAAL